MPYTQQAWHLPQITLNSKMYLRLALLQGRWMVLKYKGRGQDLRASSNKWSYIYQNMFSKIWRGAIAPLLPISDGPVLYCCQWVPLGSLFNNGLHLTFYGIYNFCRAVERSENPGEGNRIVVGMICPPYRINCQHMEGPLPLLSPGSDGPAFRRRRLL